MNPAEALRTGNLEEALAALQTEVKKQPANAQHRVFLFQLLSLLGRWDRAQTQLGVLGEMDPKTLPMVQTYQTALQCEPLRAEVFAGKRTPLIFGKPADWMALLLEALRLTAEGKHDEAKALRARAFEEAPATTGKADGKDFAWIADGDSRLGPMLEVIINGRYYWVPFHRLKEIKLEKPTDVRDFVWTPAFLTLANGGETVGLIPTRYPGSEASTDGQIRMARKTDWIEQPGDTFLGLGQRTFMTDQGELPLLDVRSIVLEPLVEPEEPSAPPEPPEETASADG